MYNLLIVEDNEEIREAIRILLKGENYEIVEAACGEDALLVFSEAIDLVILDIMMPGISGLKVCEELRKETNVPILFLTAKAQESDKLIGLMAGGDDYLVKPFSYSELLARVKSLLRRYHVYKGKENAPEESPASIITRGDITINPECNEVTLKGERVELSDIEYNILLLLMKTPGKIFSTKNIYESVWQEPFFYISNNTVMVHIRKLRMKIEEDAQNPKHICTAWGKGYRFDSAD